MRHILLALLILSCLLTQGLARRRKETLQEQTPKPDEEAQVVEANHFFSEQETSTSFNVNDLVEDKPLLFLLEPNDAQEEKNVTSEISSNHVTVTISAGNDKKTCEMTNYYSLCSLPNIKEKTATVNASCKQAPCQLRWKVLQPQTIEVDGQHKLNHLVSVNQEKNHAILKVYCTNPELKAQLPTNVHLYTNSAYEQIDTTEGEVVYLFNNEERGEYYLTTTNEAIEGCAEVSLQHAIEDIDLKQQGVLFHDFFSNTETNKYELNSKPSTDVMVEMLAHDAGMNQFQNDTSLELRLVGVTGKKEATLSELILVIDQQRQSMQFSAIFKKPTQTHDKYEIHLKGSTSQILIATINIKANDVHEIEFQEESYFDLKKGQTIKFKVVPLEKDITNIDKQNIYVSDQKKFKVDKESCGKEGCEVQLQAIEDSKGYVYIGDKPRVKKGRQQIVLQEFKKSIKSKMREGEEKFYQYKLSANKAVQMVVNSPSVIIYAARKSKCAPEKLHECYEKQVNYHNPSIYQSKEDVEIVLKVRALDNCEFVITMIQGSDPYMELKDSQPFVYLMDDNENELTFSFKLSRKQDVSFNLISPLNELTLAVFNKEKLGKEDSTKESTEAEISMDGYVCYAKDELKSQQFFIRVQKRQEYRKKYVHFTLIASTIDGNLRLQAGNPHYETLKSDAYRNYVFEFIPNKNIFLNFYTHNLQNNINLQVTISPTNEYKDKQATSEFKIDRQTDVVSIGSISEKLCTSEGQQQCELYVRIKNVMNVQADITITLMVSDTIVQLKDGIWQTYDINQAAATAHFYFLPKHEQHSITIYYHSSNVDLKIAYNLWQSDDTSIAPIEWPFPSQFNSTEAQPSPLAFKPTRFIHIENSHLKQCWPHCVVLLSILPYDKELEQFQKKPVPFFDVNHDFKIMASNNLVQLPQKMKIDLVLNKAEQKFLLVDLKYFLEKESLVFFNYLTMGSTMLKANVYSERNPRCPTTETIESDFQFVGIETEIELQTIKKRLEENNMENDKNPYLCILVYAFVESKGSLQFVSEVNDIKSIPIDTTSAVTMKREQTKLFQLNAHFEYFLKISRTSGFPYISKKLCDPKKEDMEKCLQQFRNSQEKGEQLVNKIMAISQPPCQSCVLFIKIQSKEETQLSLHSQSRYIEIELKESSPLTDVLAPNEINKYLVTGSREKQVNINIQILSGNLKVELHDFTKIHVTKENAKGTSNIHIVVPSKDQQAEKLQAGTTLIHAFGLSNLNQLHLIVQSQNPKEPANYIITYSNGQQTAYLEDGLISQHLLLSKKTTKFLYNPPVAERVFLYLSAPDAASLSNIHATIYTLQNGEDQEQKTELPVQKPTFAKKTINPTMLLHLPGKTHYQILIENNNSKSVSLSIGINNREIIYLPYDREFPFKLEMKEYIYFVVTVAAPGYVKFTMNKCYECQPFVAFTEDYKDFVDENFETEEQIIDSLVYQNVIKVKKAGGLYFKVRARDDQGSLLTVKATYSPTKIVTNKAKAGNKGNLQYKMLESNLAEITCSGVVCDKSCNGQFAYSAISSTSIDRIVSQLVCPSVSFELLGFTQKDQPEVENISAGKSSDNKLVFNHTLKVNTEYLGVKAYNSKTGEIVYYPPVELINFQGQVNKVIAVASREGNPIYIFVVLGLIIVCWVLIAYRRYKKKTEAYRPLTTDVHDTLDD